MPTNTWDPSEQWLTSKERFEEMRALLLEGETDTVIELLDDILNEMNQSKR